VADFYARLGFPAERIVVIPNGVAVDNQVPLDRDAALAEFDIPPGSHVVGYAGRLARQKRMGDLIWALQLLRQLRDRVYFLIVGDGPERARLVALARHMGCDQLVRFAGRRDDAERLIGLMDVVWLASDFEGMSNSVLEAMAAGVPVVASDIPPNRELVVDGETGYLVKVGDSVGFAQFSDRLLSDRGLTRRIGAAARQRALEHFSIQKMVDAHAALYRQVIDEQAPPEARQT
jgi:glycosyltransferase involved in cell wall biosynthesis